MRTTVRHGYHDKPQPIKVCCQDFASACQDKTDNEGYGPLIGFSVPPTSGVRGFYMGSENAQMKFCPWCGKPAPSGKIVKAKN